MDNEEKKVKTTTPKKTATKKVTSKKTTTAKTTAKTVAKKTEKKEPTKKVTEKKSSEKKKTTTKAASKVTEPKKTVKKETPVKKVTAPKEEPKKEEKIEQKVVIKEAKPSKVSKELLEIRRKRHLIEAIIVAVVVFIALVLLCNRTFLGIQYKNKNMTVSIPRFSYYINDKDHKVKFVTLRKSKYLKDYYNEYLEGFIFYSCKEGKNTFYYNEQTKTLIKEIKIEKHFAIKTIEITYDTKTPEEVCGLK